MSQVGDWIYENCSTIGQGDLILTGSLGGFATFKSQIPAGPVWYAIEENGNREVGIGTYDGDFTIVRSTIHAVLVSGEVDKTLPINPIYLTGQALVACTMNAEAFRNFLDLSGGTLTGDLSFSEAGVAQPFTTIVPTDVYGKIEADANPAGGLQLSGFSASGRGLNFAGRSGTEGTTPSQAPVYFDSRTHDGANGDQAIAAANIAFAWASKANNLARLLGAGTLVLASSLVTGNEALPDAMAGGITVSTGSGVGYAQTFKSDVAHGMTSIANTNTYGIITQTTAAGGNLSVVGLTTGVTALTLSGYATTVQTAFSLSAAIRFRSALKSGTNVTAFGSLDNLISFSNNSTVVGVLKGSGRLVLADGVATGSENSPDTDTGGICVQTGTGVGNAVTLKSTSVNHGMSTLAESDTYVWMRKYNATEGGLQLAGLTAGARAMSIYGIITTETITLTTESAISFNGSTKSGTTHIAMSDTANLANFLNFGTAKVWIKGRGDIYTAASIITGSESSPDVDQGGICINTGSNDGLALTLKNSDVNHPFSATAASNTYAQFGKRIAVDGGLWIRGMSEGTTSGLTFTSRTQTAVALGAPAPITLIATKSNGGTGESTLASTESVLSLLNGSTYALQITGNGNHYMLGSVSTGNELAPDVDTGGICAQQGAGTGSILSLKSTTVAHPFTASYEPDTYFKVGKIGSTGGVEMLGLGAGSAGLRLIGFAQTPVTTGTGVVRFDAFKSNGTTGVTSLAAAEGALSVSNAGSTILTVTGGGDLISYVAATTSTGPLHNRIVIPDTVGNRGGLVIMNATGGLLGGIAAEVRTVGGAGASVGRLDLWVQNLGITTKAVSISTTAQVSTGAEMLPDVAAGGLCVQMNGASGFIQTWKATSVAHPFTGTAENDTFGFVTRASGASGGLQIAGLSSGANPGLYLTGFMQTAVTSAKGAIAFEGYKSNGTTGVLSIGATENLLTVSTGGTVVFTIKGNGNVETLGYSGTSIGNGTTQISIGAANTYPMHIKDVTADGGLTYSHRHTAALTGSVWSSVASSTATYLDLLGIGSGGGAALYSYQNAANLASFKVRALVNTPSTSDSTGEGAIELIAGKYNAGTPAFPVALAATENVLRIYNTGTNLLLVKGNGDHRIAGNAIVRKVIATKELNVPVAAGTTTILDASQHVILNHNATIATHTLNMPANPDDGQIIKLASKSAITTLTHSGNGKTLNGGLTTIAANGFASWIYDASTTAWYRIG